MPEPIPFDAVVDEKKPAAVTLELINDTSHADIVGRAIVARDRAADRRAKDPTGTNLDTLLRAEEEVAAARTAARAHTRYWRFVAVGRPAYDAMLSDHQATKAQRDESRKKQIAAGVLPSQVTVRPWNGDTFPPALISASCLGVYLTEEDAEAAVPGDEPYMSLDEATALWNSKKFNAAELDTIFSAALIANSSNRTADLGNG